MRIDLEALPDDPAIPQGMLRSIVGEQGVLHAENDKLRRLIQRLLRAQFGRRAEQLDIAPAQLRVRVTRRPRYGCRACEGAVVQAPTPDRPIDGGIATEALVAHIVVSKVCDHLPLYRQAGMPAANALRFGGRARASSWTARRWPTGWDGPAGG